MTVYQFLAEPDWYALQWDHIIGRAPYVLRLGDTAIVSGKVTNNFWAPDGVHIVLQIEVDE